MMTNTPAAAHQLMEITPRPPIVFVAGHGSWLTDSEGRTYLDCVQGWAVNCLGHSPVLLVRALTHQAERLINCSPAFFNEPMIRLASLLAEHSGLDQVFLANSGAEANEGAIKLARKWGTKYRGGAPMRSSPWNTAFMAARSRPCPPPASRSGSGSMRPKFPVS
jgi:acetylornithine/N-succinyldiaminopimelate aminotransferase